MSASAHLQQVAAMAPPARKRSQPTSSRDDGHQTHTSLPGQPMAGPELSVHRSDCELRDAMADLAISGDKAALKFTALPELGGAVRPIPRVEDEQTQVSTSSTKPASIDGKSTASGTTFAMDEKESLRPDDSASVKAAEEEDSCSGTGSGAPNSRMGSEAGGKAFRDQFHEISERIYHVPSRPIVAVYRGIPGIEEEAAHAAPSPLQTPLQAPVTMAAPRIVSPENSAFKIEYRNPDDKLLEALGSPKDRLFVLRLEHDIINFIQHSGDPTLDLRTPNSFYRLLAHKLADYYALTHHVDGAMTAVKMYRTPYCRIRTPLSAYPQSNPSNENPASTQPAVKIMRRAGLVRDGNKFEFGVNTTAGSIAPSKAGSEAGDDSGRATGLVSPTESNLGKDRIAMTREEREAKYKETRDRIFKDFEDVESIDAPAGTDAGAGISRTSSTNGRRKTRKQRNADDGFEARSHYTAYYPAMQYPGSSYDQTPASPAYYHPGMPQQYPMFGETNGMDSTMYQSSFGPGYQSLPPTPGYHVPPPAQFPVTASSTTNGFQNAQPYPNFMQQVSYQYYQQPQSSPALGQCSSAMSSPALSSHGQISRPQSQTSDQQWPQMTYQYPYPQPVNQQQFYPPQNPPQNSMPALPAVPYQYGQLPCPPNLPGSRNAHPLPGSYNRQQALNPQIRSFVPSSTSQPPFVGNMPQDAAYNGQFSSTPGTASGLAHNGASNAPVHVSSMPQFGSFVPTPESKSLPSRKSQNRLDENQAPGKSTLAKWGTPANLPPKPPPPDPPGMPSSLPQSIPAPPSLPKISNGQSMPIFQNGMYAASGHNHQ
ncbi:MAG: hypothetical protein LQ344_007388 [Seirophora lacunosa]|nr:MAG: hypothetical protein LQ344_007388 [Seirophora lacunosa]